MKGKGKERRRMKKGRDVGGNVHDVTFFLERLSKNNMKISSERFWGRNSTWGSTKTKLRGFSPLANYTDRATAACRRS
jgi:hypothetical protein